MNSAQAVPGATVGKLTLIERTQKSKALFRCSCGLVKEIWIYNVRPGNIISCGCVRKSQTASLRRSHGETGTPLHQCWKDMKKRSTPGSSYQRRRPTYQGVGRDPRWDDFEAFAEDMGSSYFPGACLTRYRDSGNYTKENCRWQTRSENSLEMWEQKR